MMRTFCIAAMAATVCLALSLPSIAAPAQAASLDHLRDARYCEILGLKGLPPTGKVTVWNTIGLNKCPAEWWNAFQAGPLASELGDTLVVLNGPRHFLMDSVSEGRPGPTRSFHGQQMRKVATIDIKSAADLVQTPYTDRVITRDNTWSWKKGSTVYELVAPGGDTYVMQSYAQIKDPTLTLAKLTTLGRRLDLPTGWHYRTASLKTALNLSANGGATITQDELQNTYQLATTTRPVKQKRRRRALTISAKTKAVKGLPAGTVEDRGTVTGSPFGKGTVVIKGTLTNGKLDGTIRLTFKNGSVLGTVQMPFAISANMIVFDGTSKLTSGTGAYRGISSRTLKSHDTNTLDGQAGRLAASGSVTY